MLLRATIWFGVLLTWLIPAGVVRADLVFEFAVGGAPVSAIQIPGPGATVPIDVYLRQMGATTILTAEGLAMAGIKVTFDDPTVAAVLSVDDIVHNSEFDDLFGLFKAVNPSSAELNMAVSDILSPVFPEPTDPDRILLGTFTFTGLSMGTTGIGVTSLSDFDDIITGLGTALDDLIAAGEGTVAVVPEPSSVAISVLLLGAASVVTLVRARRRRREKAAAGDARKGP